MYLSELLSLKNWIILTINYLTTWYLTYSERQSDVIAVFSKDLFDDFNHFFCSSDVDNTAQWNRLMKRASLIKVDVHVWWNVDEATNYMPAVLFGHPLPFHV